jgi:hypothetical protein
MVEGRRRLRRRRRKPKRGWRRPEKRRWWWAGGLMKVKSPWMSELERSSPPKVVQSLSLLLLAIMYLLLNNFYCKYMLNN